MLFHRRNKKSFTIFEIIIAMLVAGILATIAAPKVVELVNEARRGEEEYTVGNVKSGIALTYLGNVTRGITPQYPAQLDNAALAKASQNNPIYGTVLQHGITKDWEKLEQLRYRGPTGQEYEYDPNDGTFEPVAGGGEEEPPVIPPFVTTFGGAADEWSGKGILTSDGGYIMIGTTNSFGAGGGDLYIVKTDAYGNKLWEKTFGGSADDYGTAIQETSDGGFILAGGTGSSGAGMEDAYIVKIDASGNIEWEKTFGGSDWDGARNIQETAINGGYIMTGYTMSFGGGDGDAYIVKIDSSGGMEWSQTYGGIGWDEGWGIQETSDGGYIMGGYTSSFGTGNDAYIVKMDSSGTAEWDKFFADSWGSDVHGTSDGGYILSGVAGGDIYLVKTDSSGTTEWEKNYGGTGYDIGWNVSELADGGYIISGSTDSFGAGGDDIYFIKLDSSGAKVWEKTYGGTSNDWGYSAQQVPDGGYMIGAGTWSFGAGGSDFYLIKTDADGNAPDVTWSSP